MDKDATLKILDIQEALAQKESFQPLIAEYDMLNAKFLAVAETLSPEQRDVIFDYIGLMIEINLRTLEYAVKEQCSFLDRQEKNEKKPI